MARADSLTRPHVHEWLSMLADQLRQRVPQVLVTVIHTQGSTPRDTGAHMWVGADFIVDTIGGGHLEWKVIAAARSMLERAGRTCRVERYPLGPALGQCCGGVVWVLFEYLDHRDADWCEQIAAALIDGTSVTRTLTLQSAHGQDAGKYDTATEGLTAATAQGLSRDRFTMQLQRADRHAVPDANNATVVAVVTAATTVNTATTSNTDSTDSISITDVWPAPAMHVVVCGAGHIGSAIIKLLADLPVQVTWLDPRDDCWPADIPGNVRVLQGDTDEIPDMPDHAYWLVLTHNHALDLAIIDAIFKHKPFAFLGLIGSRSKKARFVSRLSRRHRPDLVQRICCPVGVVQTSSKLPPVIAVSVVAQLLGFMSA